MDLTTSYLGLELAHPIVASAGPLTQTVEGVEQLAAGGASAIVLYSLFEEQVRAEVARDHALMDLPSESFAEALDYWPDVEVTTKSVAHAYLSFVERACAAVDVPVIASLNGADLGGWVDFARELEGAGASAIELNIYAVPGDVRTPGAEVVQRHVDIVAAVTDAVGVPVSVKLSPFFASTGHVALQLVEAGASGLVLFNRFLQPDINLETLEPDTAFELSSAHEGRLPRTWIAALRNHTTASLAGSTGVQDADDVVRYLLAGADVVMTTSALIRHGRPYVRQLREGLQAWMARKEFGSLAEVRGLLALPVDADADHIERTGYVQAIQAAKRRYGTL